MQTIHLRLFVSLFIVLSVLVSTFAPASANAQPLEGIENFMDSLVRAQMEELHIPNAAVAVVAGGEVVFLQGYGSMDLDARLPVDPETTLFRVGSVSKLFTWTAVMQLKEQGKLDLNEDVNTYLDFHIPSRLLHSPDTRQVAPITLLHLMTHTTGFEAYPDEIFRLSPQHLLPLGEYVRKNLPARVFPPGEVAAYSNYGTSLAGYIVERVSGLPYAEYVERNILLPLDMHSSALLQPVPGPLSHQLARPYRFVDGEYLPGEFEFMQEPEGGMSSTAGDMAKFMLAHLQQGSYQNRRILQPGSALEMQTLQPTRHPNLGGMALGFMHGTFNGKRTLFHGGSTMVFDSGLYLLPEENIGFFVAYSGANHLVHTTLFQAFLDRYLPQRSAPALTAEEGARERSMQYVGEYHQNTRSYTTDESLTSLMMGIVNVEVDPDGYLQVTHTGETNRFVEIEPGVYHNLRQGRSQDYFGPFQTILFDTDPSGRQLLVTDGPMTYSKAPWYASGMFTLPALVLVVLLALVSLIIWGTGGMLGLIKRRPSVPYGARAARWSGAAFSMVTLVFVLGTISSSNPDPVYLLPPAAFGVETAAGGLMSVFPWMLAILGAAVFVFNVVAWRRSYWNILARLHYLWFTGGALLLVWIFYYWNII